MHYTGLRYSDVTPKQVYLSRRRLLSASAAALGAFVPGSFALRAGTRIDGLKKSPLSTSETPTPAKIVTQYTNFYEFGTGKDEPVKNAKNFKTSPWTIAIEGEVARPKVWDLDAVLRVAPLEERIYRHRCVEGWSIVVPWIGFSLGALLQQAQPTSKAKFVAFQSFYDPKQMLSPRQAGIRFPYGEGLRIDEAMHPLALLCSGVYGETLPPQNGAPLRLVLPWKYGFKSIKSIVKIRLTEKQPPTTWNLEWGEAYGFYANVNPQVDHPTHSQASEDRLGVGLLGQHIKTQMFNGYADQVAGLYRGLDLSRNY